MTETSTDTPKRGRGKPLGYRKPNARTYTVRFRAEADLGEYLNSLPAETRLEYYNECRKLLRSYYTNSLIV